MNNILVVGDFILDKYLIGEVKRISPEAPVPILNVEKVDIKLGGAANVSVNITETFDINNILISLLNSNDFPIIQSLVKTNSLSMDYLVQNPNIKTITKTRVVSHNQQIMRIDENDFTDSAPYISELISKFDEALVLSRIVIISDYKKGLLTDNFTRHIIQKSNLLQVPVFVDPKGIEWNKYKNAFLIKPNFKEFSEYSKTNFFNNIDSLTQISKVAKDILINLDIKYMIVTLGENGSVLVDQKGDFKHFINKANEIIDVTGAGDTYLGTLASTYFESNDLFHSAKIANLAASIKVTKFGTYSPRKYELFQNINERIFYYGSKKYFEFIKYLNKKEVTIANGVFDIVHLGHLKLLKEASKLSKILLLVINSDLSVKKIKGDTRPINDELSRAKFLLSLDFINFVIIFDSETPYNVIKDITPQFLVKGSDYKDKVVVGSEFSKEVVFINLEDNYSTTSIVKKIKG